MKAALIPSVAITLLLTAVPPARAMGMDDSIEAAARSTYVFQHDLKGDKVKVHSRDGNVVLTGKVRQQSHKDLAEAAVAGLPGVRSVDNRLKVKGRQPSERSDTWIQMKIKTALMYHRDVSGLGTDVDVKDGKVTLRGEAENQAEKDLATAYAKDIDGVAEVRNEMTVAMAPREDTAMGRKKEGMMEKMDDASITARVKMALLIHRSTSALRTHVETLEGVVTVTGEARSAVEKDLVTRLVGEVHGVKSVNNKMTYPGSAER